MTTGEKLSLAALIVSSNMVTVGIIEQIKWQGFVGIILCIINGITFIFGGGHDG